MPDYIISGRVPFEDEDETHVITGCNSEDDAMLKFKAMLYGNDPAAAAGWKERHGDMGEFKDDPWPAYVTGINVSWEPELGDALRSIRDARDHHAAHGEYPEGLLRAGQQFDDWAADIAQEILDKVEGKENDGVDVEQNSEG